MKKRKEEKKKKKKEQNNNKKKQQKTTKNKKKKKKRKHSLLPILQPQIRGLIDGNMVFSYLGQVGVIKGPLE